MHTHINTDTLSQCTETCGRERLLHTHTHIRYTHIKHRYTTSVSTWGRQRDCYTHTHPYTHTHLFIHTHTLIYTKHTSSVPTWERETISPSTRAQHYPRTHTHTSRNTHTHTPAMITLPPLAPGNPNETSADSLGKRV